jgi:hypothetical protein
MIAKYAIPALLIASVVMGGVIAYLNARLDAEVLKRKEATSQLELCVKNHENNRRIAEEYHEQITDLDKRLSASKRMFNNKCIPVSTIGVDEAPARGYVRQNGIPANELLEYGRTCGEIEINLRLLQEWVKK